MCPMQFSFSALCFKLKEWWFVLEQLWDRKVAEDAEVGGRADYINETTGFATPANEKWQFVFCTSDKEAS